MLLFWGKTEDLVFQNIKVSVIIPIYNQAQFLRKCLDSVLNQSLKGIEIICVNDGSTDDTLAILEEYKSKGHKIIIINQENSGLAKSRNVGLMNATGEFIGFLDSDDWVDLNFYENLYNAAISTNSDIAVSSIARADENEVKEFILKIKKQQTALNTNSKYKIAFIPQACYVWNKIYNREKLIQTKVMFPEGAYYEDIVFSHKVTHYLHWLVTVPNVNYYYRINPKSIVWVKSDKHSKDLQEQRILSEMFVQAEGIKMRNVSEYIPSETKSFKLFGIMIWEARKFVNITKHYLFGIFPLFEYSHIKKI